MYSCGRFITNWYKTIVCYIGGRSYLQKFDRLRLETLSMLQHCQKSIVVFVNFFPNEQISLSAEGEGPKDVEKETQQLERAFKPMPFLSKFWEMQVRVYSTEILSSARVFRATGRAIPSLPYKVFVFVFLQLFVYLLLVLQGFFRPGTNKTNLSYVLNVEFTIYSTR